MITKICIYSKDLILAIFIYIILFNIEIIYNYNYNINIKDNKNVKNVGKIDSAIDYTFMKISNMQHKTK